nr:PQQ-dependent sugar dehydrogenase [Plantactinospora alkalitolerans]
MRTTGRTGRLVILVAVVAALVAAGVGVGLWRGWFADPSVSDAPRARAGTVETVVGDLAAPWGLAFLPDGSALVTERDTRRILRVSGTTAREVARIDEAAPAGEGGLLGIAVSPDYAQDRWVYVYYTAAEDNRIARLRLGERPEPLLTGIPRGSRTHNGGRLAFGPDGMLYAGTGDAGQRDASQDRDSLAGKILRMTRDGRPAPGNPFGSLVYSYGHRNVQGLGWDAAGTMYASEFGQNHYDELNRISAGGNYGWPEVEGDSDDSRYVAPIATWGTDEASPSGIAVVGDRVWLACLRGQRLYRIGAGGQDPEALLTDEYGRLRHVAAAPDGSLWVLTSNRDGRGSPNDGDDRILRLVP